MAIGQSLRKRLRLGRIHQPIGVAMVAVGLVLVLGVAGYYAYAHYARSGFDDLSFSVEPISAATSDQSSTAGQDASSAENGTTATHEVPASSGASPVTSIEDLEPAGGSDRSSEQAGALGSNGAGPLPLDSFAAVYPGAELHPKYWGNPLWAGSAQRQGFGLPDGFLPTSGESAGATPTKIVPASRMIISAIGVDAVVDDLKILDLGDSQQYETPKNIVGHIPTTARPGQPGNGWYFGHLQSPIKGEGNVFRLLPSLSKLIKDGDPIFVSLHTTGGEYLYQVVEGKVLHPTELAVLSTTESEITLVTCYPPLVYDHRYVVTAKLVGFRDQPATEGAEGEGL